MSAAEVVAWVGAAVLLAVIVTAAVVLIRRYQHPHVAHHA